MEQFFIATPLDAEKITLQEMQRIWPQLLGKDARPHGLPFPEYKILEGGIELQTEFFIGLQFNFFLKTANRILLRMASFKVRDLPKFYNKIKALPWNRHLPNSAVAWKIAASQSRLNNEKRLLETASEALNEVLPRGSAPAPGVAQVEIYIRLFDDHCTVSLDTSGEHLHKRGWMPLRGEAPLRETIASRLLLELKQGASAEQISQTVLFDPMMGSGTFLCEARALEQGNFSRSYAFQGFKSVPKIFLSPAFAFNYAVSQGTQFKAYYGLDIEEKMIPVVKSNFLALETELKKAQRKDFVAQQLVVRSGNSLLPSEELKNELASTGAGLWMILNPPYGERLEGVSRNLSSLVESLCQAYRPQKLGVLFPEKEKITKIPNLYKMQASVSINNGGIRCLYTILTLK